MDIGRNDPCPCGSGRKYKHCCLRAVQSSPDTGADIAWRRVRRALEGLPKRMVRFVADTYGPGAVAEAWNEFTFWQNVPPAPDGPQASLFWPWLFHQWSPDPHETGVADKALHEQRPTQVLLERQGDRLDGVLRQYLSSCLSNPFSFFEVLQCEPGRGFRLQDVFTAEVHEVLERSASLTLSEGDLLYGLLAQAEGVTLLEATSPVALPLADKLDVIPLRSRIGPPGGFPRQKLHEWAFEIRELYLRLADRALNPRMPRLHNTDGDPLVLHKMVFEVESAQAVLEALSGPGFEAEGIERDAQGAVVRATVTWTRSGNRKHKSWSNTVLGTIRLERLRLTAEVNSVKRAAAFRRLIERALGERARFRASEVQSAEKLFARAGEDTPAAGRDEAQALAESPEVQALLDEHIARHYEAWVRQKIPALGGRTPLAAVKDADGREMVEALVRDFERGNRTMPQPVDEAIFRRLRERLGL